MGTVSTRAKKTSKALYCVALLAGIGALGVGYAVFILTGVGSWPPPNEPLLPPNEGTLWVYVIGNNGTYIDAHVTVSNSSKSFSVTGGRSGPIPFYLDVGSYTVAGSYSSRSANPQNVTVVAGKTVMVTLSF